MNRMGAESIAGGMDQRLCIAGFHRRARFPSRDGTALERFACFDLDDWKTDLDFNHYEIRDNRAQEKNAAWKQKGPI